MAYGHVTVTTDKGPLEIIGPQVLVTGSGAKGVFAHEDTLWITVHPWDGDEDVEQVEAYVISPSYEALEQEVKS